MKEKRSEFIISYTHSYANHHMGAHVYGNVYLKQKLRTCNRKIVER